MKYVTQIFMFSLILSSCSSGGPGEKSYTLNWQIPSQRVDGSSLLLDEIKGYQLCYTIDSGSELCETFDIDVPSRNSYTFGSLVPGAYRITLATIDKNDIYSVKSEVLEYTVN